MLNAILSDIRSVYGLDCRNAAPVNGGWLNRLWRAESDEGPLLIKLYSNQRFKPRQIESIEAAVQRQMVVSHCGVPMPRIYTVDGRAIRWLGDAAYMVMSFSGGRNETPETITCGQLRSLGECCARLHAAFSALPAEGVKGYPFGGGQILRGLHDNFHALCAGIPEDLPEYRSALLVQETILASLTPEYLDSLPKGIAHEDFTPDNLLFDDEGVAAVIDFDRNCFSFLWHDVSRAILSFALEGDALNPAKVRAFAEGYGLPLRNVADALRAAWCIEAPWWIQPSCFVDFHGKAVRFRDEIMWVTAHWDELDTLFE